MNGILLLPLRALLWLLQSLPLQLVAHLGRSIGTLAYILDARHRRVARENIRKCLGQQLTPAEQKSLLHEHFRRLGENFACAIKTAAMPAKALEKVLTIGDLSSFPDRSQPHAPPNIIVALGHFGNFELFSRVMPLLKGYRAATTYRALSPPQLNNTLLNLRQSHDCRFFERRTDSAELRSALQDGGWTLGLLSDQHGGRSGLLGPFLGHTCSTTTAPAVLALRYQSTLLTAICYRTGLARWHIEPGKEIPTRLPNGQPREIADIVRDMNAAFETAILKDPANWFWVHRRWKPGGKTARQAANPQET
ncbi:MAG: lysophospholipid acyltransferase family protein [Limisphaerales bacterium]|jgi:lauroyl/myristoyl acyltransferase